MFQSIKMYIYGAIAAVGLFLVGMLKYLSSKNDKLEKEVEINKQNVIVLEKKEAVRKDVDKAIDQVREEAKVIQNEINDKRDKKMRPSVGDKFGDPRI